MRVEGDIVWVEAEVRRQAGWVALTCRIVFVLTLQGVVAANWRRWPKHRWILHTACVPVKEDGIASGGEWSGPCCVHAAGPVVSKWQADD